MVFEMGSFWADFCDDVLMCCFCGGDNKASDRGMHRLGKAGVLKAKRLIALVAEAVRHGRQSGTA